MNENRDSREYLAEIVRQYLACPPSDAARHQMLLLELIVLTQEKLDGMANQNRG